MEEKTKVTVSELAAYFAAVHQDWAWSFVFHEHWCLGDGEEKSHGNDYNLNSQLKGDGHQSAWSEKVKMNLNSTTTVFNWHFF